MPSDRRRAPRIEILGRLHGHVASLDVAVMVREISLGGLSMETSFPFPDGVIHDFRLELGDGSSVELRGRVLRCQPVTSADGGRAYVSGVQFVDDEPAEVETSVGGIVDRMK